jgi:hypothetical protein
VSLTATTPGVAGAPLTVVGTPDNAAAQVDARLAGLEARQVS